jgi:hypothetical protein
MLPSLSLGLSMSLDHRTYEASRELKSLDTGVCLSFSSWNPMTPRWRNQGCVEDESPIAYSSHSPKMTTNQWPTRWGRPSQSTWRPAQPLSPQGPRHRCMSGPENHSEEPRWNCRPTKLGKTDFSFVFISLFRAVLMFEIRTLALPRQTLYYLCYTPCPICFC